MSSDDATRRRAAGFLAEAIGATDLSPWQLDLLDQIVDMHRWPLDAPIEQPYLTYPNRGRPLRRLPELRVYGRPAPQGSKRVGAQGQMMEQSPYLVGWAGGWKGGKARGKRIHGAVERDLYQWYADQGVAPDDLPWLTGPVGVDITFYLDPTNGDPWEPPDVDKLARATFDALTAARLWEDDGRVIDARLRKRAAHTTGALIRAWEIGA